MQFLWTTIKTSLKNLAANKMRSFLTMLGIIIGVASVILVMAIGEGAQKLIIDQVNQFGTNLIGVLPGKSEEKGPPISAFGVTVTSLKIEDAEKIAGLSEIKAASSYVTGQGSVSVGSDSGSYDFMGVSSDYLQVEDTAIKSGRFFTESAEKSMTREAVLGYEVKKELFKEGEKVLGKRIKINSTSFKVIGVMEKRGATLFGQFDSRVYVPVTTAQKVLAGIDYVNFIRAKIKQGKDHGLVKTKIEKVLRHSHDIKDPKKDDFTVKRMSQLLSMLGQITGSIQAFLVIVVAISLFVGGIGIMNIMIVSLSERVKEVGLKKALGATDGNIMTQFLTESVTLSFLGGLVGVGSGLGLGVLISKLIRIFTNLNWSFIISPVQVLLALLVSFLVGVVFGIYPARKAANLDQIDALRYE